MDPQKAVNEILNVTRCLVPPENRAVVKNIFLDSGIGVSPDLAFMSFHGNPGDCFKTLMGKSTAMPAVHIVVRRVIGAYAAL